MRLFTSQEITCYVTVLNEKKSKRSTRIPAKLIYRVASSLKIILPVYKIRYDYTINTMRLVQLTNIKYYIMSSENFCFFLSFKSLHPLRIAALSGLSSTRIGIT